MCAYLLSSFPPSLLPQEDVHSEELVLPGTIEEMTQFESHASSTAQYSISASFPSINIHIPSKRFLETLYNRYLQCCTHIY